MAIKSTRGLGGSARMAACKLKPASRTSCALITTPGRSSNAICGARGGARARLHLELRRQGPGACPVVLERSGLGL